MTKDREEFLINKVKKDWCYLGEISEEEQTDAVIDAAMERDKWAIVHIKDKSKKTYERCLEAVKSCGDWLRYVPDQMQTDEVIDAAMGERISAFEYIKDENKKTYERCVKAFKYDISLLHLVPEELREKVINIYGTDEDAFIEEIKEDWSYLGKIKKKNQTDAVIDAAMDIDVRAFQFIRDKKKKTLERCLRAVKGNGHMLRYVPKKMQTDEVIDAALEESRNVMIWIKDNKMKTVERYLIAGK